MQNVEHCFSLIGFRYIKKEILVSSSDKNSMHFLHSENIIQMPLKWANMATNQKFDFA